MGKEGENKHTGKNKQRWLTGIATCGSGSIRRVTVVSVSSKGRHGREISVIQGKRERMAMGKKEWEWN